MCHIKWTTQEQVHGGLREVHGWAASCRNGHVVRRAGFPLLLQLEQREEVSGCGARRAARHEQHLHEEIPPRFAGMRP